MNSEQFEDILIYFSKSLMGKENEEDILWDLAKNCISKLGFVDCVIYLVDQNRQLLVQKAAYGPKNPKDKALHNPVSISMGEGITGNVAKTRRAALIPDTSKDPRYIEDDANRLSEICVPIVHENHLYGVIDCEHPEKCYFNERHLKMLSAIASICAIKIKSVRAGQEVLKKQEKLLKIREEMLELKVLALNSQLNPHFLFNSLNAIQYFVTSEKKKLALEYLSTFSRLIRFYLRQLGNDTVSLYNEIDMLHWYLKLQKLRYDDSFDYVIAMEKSSETLQEAIIPSFVTHTLFENIIERSMFNQKKGQHFKISFRSTNSEVVLVIQYQEFDSKNTTPPEYRARILKWQDQIKLLNTAKGYNIKNESKIHKIGERWIGNITLTLPNLR